MAKRRYRKTNFNIIGDTALVSAGGTYGIEALTSGSLSAPLATGYNIFNPAATAGTQAAANVAATGATTANYLTGPIPSFIPSLSGGTVAATTGGSFLSSVGSALGTTLGALSTTAKALGIAAMGMEAYSIIKSRNTLGQCNNVQSLSSQFSSDSTEFNSLASAITPSNAQQTLSQLQSIYSNANQVGSSIIYYNP